MYHREDVAGDKFTDEDYNAGNLTTGETRER